MNRQFNQIENAVRKNTPPGRKIPWWFWPLLLVAIKIDNFFAWVWSLFQ